MQIQNSLDRARAILAGGCDSPVRSGHSIGAEMFVQSGASGAYAFGEDGRRYIDYIMGYGPLLFGHTHPALVSDLDTLAAHGWLWGTTHPEELRLGERIRFHIPAIERLRFTTTGTEAVMGAVRVARACTRRSLIVKFAGNYHGHSDLALFDAGASAHTDDASRSGITPGVMSEVIVARYNDLADLDEKLRGRERELAAILVEPIVGNMGYVTPIPEFIAGLRERASRHGALLIFDEVITWLRLGLDGAGARVGIAPDLVTVGKILGGGAPIAAFGGRAAVMAALAPEGKAFTGGTHAGNPFSVGMAHRVLDLLEGHREYYVEMDRLARRLADGIRAIFNSRELPYAVVQHESIVDFKFRPGPPTQNFDDALRADKALYRRYYDAMFARGILLPPSQNEVMFLSTAHTAEDVETTLVAIDGALGEIL
ncbi:MAG TPA: glutamate-1-semialdehyde 2,1-aminomutase [Candidatus Dormibacteraeota bacterium]|nr:glutamate-1-semialdehyde 2,1-aminomutase [Candidatus Dormibacteraeota bacterium]